MISGGGLSQMPSSKLLTGTLVLSAASLITRVLGFGYRIVVVRYLGAEGIGLYEMVFPIYSLILVLSTAGIPIAISKMVSDALARHDRARVQLIMRVSVLFLFCSGLVLTFASFQAAPWLAERFFTDSRAYWPFVGMIPAITIVAVSSAFRGYFQGTQNMVPNALAQIVEQVIRISLGLVLALRLLPRGIEFAALGLSAAMVMGELAGMIVILDQFIRRNGVRLIWGFWSPDRKSGSQGSVFNEMLGFSVPSTLTRVLAAAGLSLEAVLIPRRLVAAGFSIPQATELYGQFSGIAMSLISFPGVLTISLAISMLPAVSEARAVNNWRLIRFRTHQALKLTILAALPFSAVYLAFPGEICDILFSSPEAKIPLAAVARGAPFLYLQQTTNGILQGLGKMHTVFRHTVAGEVVILGSIYYLTADPRLGIEGAALGIILGAALVTLLNLRSISLASGFKIDWHRLLISPLSAAAVFYFTAKAVFKLFAASSLTALSTASLAGGLAYLTVLLASGGITLADFQRVPFLNRVFKF